MIPGINAAQLLAGGTAFPEVLDAAATNASLASPFSVALPSGIKAGEVLIAEFYRGGNNTQTLTLPAGWVKLIDEAPVGASTFRSVVAWKIADGTEGSTMSVSSTLTSSQATRVVVVRIAGAVSVECSANVNTSGTTVDPPSLSPSWGTAFTLFLAACMGTSNSALSSYPSGWTGVIATGPSAIAQLQSRAASANPGVFTLSASMVLAAYTLAVKPAVL